MNTAKRAAAAHSHVWPACLLVLGLLAGLGLAPISPSLIFLAATGMAWAVAAVGLDAFSGYLGQPSFGHAAFVAAGAYVSTILSTHYGLSFPLAVVVALLAVGVLSAVIGGLLLRLREFGLVLGTFFLTFVTTALLTGTLLAPWTGAASGLQTPQVILGRGINISEGRAYYYTCLVFLAVVALLSAVLVDATPGRVLRLVKRSDIVARSVGVRPQRVRLAAFVWSATLAACGGCLLSLGAGYIAPDNFGVQASIMLFAMVAVGGLGSIVGPIVGAVALMTLPAQLQFAETAQQVLFAALLLVVFVLARGGLYGAVASQLNAPGSRRRRTPAAVDDTTPEVAAMPTEGLAVPRASRASFGLEVQDVSLHYGGVQALRHVTLDVHAGSVHALVGPNGAGKTSLLNCITGLEATDAGAIRLVDADGERTGRLVHRTFQNQSIVPDLTALENVVLGLHRDRRSFGRGRKSAAKVRGQAGAALAALDIPQIRQHTRGADLSLAEAKLVDIARGLVGHPALLVLDEPTAGLSVQEMAVIREAIIRLNRTGLTILVVSHHVGWIRSVTQRASVLVAGQVLAHGPTQDVLESEVTRRAFLGAHPDEVAS